MAKLPPGTEEVQRFLPKLRYELIDCGLHGHELIGTHAKKLRPTDAIVAFERDGLRWYRCLRCDSWLALPSPKQPTEEYIPPLESITPPLRGRPLRNRYVLRAIAVDRAFHVIVLGLFATGILLFARHHAGLESDYFKVLNALQGASGGATQNGELSRVQGIFKLPITRIYELGLLVTAYATLEAIEMIGLWFAKRWAEYLTFIATLVFIPYEVYEIIHKPTALKIVAFIINVAIAMYLLYAKRLFGLRGGGKAEQRENDRDTGWQAIERATPKLRASSK
jgi:uncharacterized membrane protein (DUF2068 family)